MDNCAGITTNDDEHSRVASNERRKVIGRKNF